MLNIFNLLFSGWLAQLLEGTLITIILSLCSFTLGFIIALLLMSARVFKIKAVIYCENIYTGLFRGLPELLVIFFIFFSLSNLINILNDYMGVNWQGRGVSFVAGVMSVGLIAGCYLSEVLRGGLKALPKGQIEAGLAIGMTNYQVLARIIYPQVIGYAFKPIINICLLIIKDSSLVMVVGLPELMFKSNLAVVTTNKPFLFYSLAGVLYLLMTITFSTIANYIDPNKKYIDNSNR